MSLAIVPVTAIAVTYGIMFFPFGCVVFVLALPYLLAIVKEKYTLPEVALGSSKQET